VKRILLSFLFILSGLSFLNAQTNSLIFPDSTGWNTLNENELLSFNVKSSHENVKKFSVEGTEGLDIHFDTLGYFSWKPSFDVVDRVTKFKDFTVIFQAQLVDGRRERKAITFTVNHVNRPPVVDELPTAYVKQSNLNTYQIASDYVYDPDGDPLVFKSIQSQMPEGSSLSSAGQFTWTPSRTQFSALKNNPLNLEFIVQDQPDKAETKGKLKVSQTQQDLPSEINIVPGDTLFSIKEDETLNLKIYISDPNGDDNVRSAGFISTDKRIPTASLKENTQLQYEFTWTPGYEFVDDTQTSLTTEIIFFVLDKSNNRVQKKVKIKVFDTENMVKKDAHLFQKYRTNLVDAMVLIQQLDANQKKLNGDYKKAKKGKKHRSIVNASLGAVTGFTPIAMPDSRVRQAPTASKFSSASPSGSMTLWHPAHAGFERCCSIRPRTVLGTPGTSSGNGGTTAGAGGGGVPSRLSRIHLPRTTGDVRSACDVNVSTPPLPNRPRRASCFNETRRKSGP
jgi:hypothetical protein